MASQSMESRNRNARELGFDSYTDRLRRQRFYKATGDRSVLPAKVNPRTIRTTVASIPTKAQPAGSVIRKAMDRLAILPGAIRVTPVAVTGNMSGSVADGGNVARSILSRATQNPTERFTLTYYVLPKQGGEWERQISMTGSDWLRWFVEHGDLETGIAADVAEQYALGSWVGAISAESNGSFVMS